MRKELQERKFELRLITGGLFGIGEPPWPHFGKPFNGQQGRRELVSRLIEDFQPDLILETGTFLGHTTEFLAKTDAEVHTVEFKRSFHHAARFRMGRHHDNVTQHHGDSSEKVVEILDAVSPSRTFAYLDAHWWGPNPLAEELDALFTASPESLIVIDDFRVDEDPGYAYDYANGEALSLDLLKLPNDVRAGFPGLASTGETGTRTGALILASGQTTHGVFDAVAADNLLRSAHSLGASGARR